MRLASRPVGDRFFPRFRTPSSIAQINVPFITESTNPRQRAREYINQATSIYRKAAQYRPYPRTSADEERSIFLLFLSLEPRPLVEHATIDSGPTRSSAPRYCTIVLRLALGASGAHIFIVFSLERSDAADASRLKATNIEDLHPHAYYKGHLNLSQVIIIFFRSLLLSPTPISMHTEAAHLVTAP